ncbi:hypothetical protein TNCV_4570041 [Trichonephila clavipes]|nr:hypothetical protein TNCV_4570041 [Trichonephila clavipes]
METVLSPVCSIVDSMKRCSPRQKERASDILSSPIGPVQDELLAAVGALIELLPYRYDCNDDCYSAVSSGTQGETSDFSISHAFLWKSH